MSSQDDDLKSLWQTSRGIDIDDLLRRVASERRRMNHLLWFEIISTVLGIGVVVYYDRVGIFGQHRPIIWLLLAFCMALQLWMWWWRRGLWTAVSQAPMDLLNLQLKRARVGLRIARYYAYGTPVFVVIGMLVAHFADGDLPKIDISDLARGALMTGLIAMVVGFTLFGVRMMRRYEARIAWITERIAQLSPGDD